MIKNMSDFPFPGKNIVCKQEENFKSTIEQLFGTKVMQTLFMKGAKDQYHLYIWYEANTDDPCFDEGNDSIQQKLIETYFDCYHIPDSDKHETYLHTLNYRNALISYSYGHAEASVKKSIQSQYARTVVSLDHASNTFIVESDCVLTDRENDILQTCYQFLKEYDHYNILTLQDVKIRLIKTGDPINLNDIHMTNRKI